MIDPCDPPREVMISWYDGTWEHRAYWGEDLFQYGTAGPSRFAMGALPAPGQWVRLQVPASSVGLAGINVTGIKFSTFAGKAWFDRVGLEPGSSAAIAPAAASEPIEVRSFSDRLRDLATLLAYGRGRTSFRYQSLQSTSPWSASSPSTPAVHSGPYARRYSLYTPELNLLAETELTTAQSPTIAYEYIWFGGQPLAQITTATNDVAWYFNDHLGAPLIQTDAAANVVWRVERDPYGTTYTTRAGADRHQPLSLPGQEVTVENETAYNIFRWYRSGWGRYTQPDPLGLETDRHPYRYVYNNPIKNIDPLGLDTVGCDSIPNSWETPCRLECCASHDECFQKNKCSEGAWGWNPKKSGCDYGAGCKDCNKEVVKCWDKCGTSKKDDPKKPNYYCGKLGKYVNLPGDFADLAAAEKACQCDHSLGCKTPVPPSALKPKPTKPMPSSTIW
jgi:RHS repeat-associated protein